MRDGAIEKWEEVMADFFQSAKKHDANLKKAVISDSESSSSSGDDLFLSQSLAARISNR